MHLYKQRKTSQTERQGRGRHLEGLAAKNKNKARPGPHTGLVYIAGRKQLKATAKKQTKQNRTRNYCANLLASRWRCTLDWRRSARHQALSRAAARFSIPRCHMPTFFAAVIQPSPSLTTTLVTHFRPSPLRGIASKASRFFWGQFPQDVAGRSPRLDPCTTSCLNMIPFMSFESPWRVRGPVNRC